MKSLAFWLIAFGSSYFGGFLAVLNIAAIASKSWFGGFVVNISTIVAPRLLIYKRQNEKYNHGLFGTLVNKYFQIHTNHISAFRPYGRPFMTSGAIQYGVPVAVRNPMDLQTA